MLSILSSLLGLGLQILHAQATNYTFAFGNTQGDFMVLQQAPWRAQIWGTSATVGATVVVELLIENGEQLIEKLSVIVDSNGVWKTYFNPRKASNDEYMITATSNSKTIQLKNVLFGDVYVCSGQSNMQFTVDSAFNNSNEIQAANNYPYIRVFTASLISADTPQLQLLGIQEKWSIASNTSVGGGNWTYMSAVCWFFGRNMYSYLKYPIGLIATSYGGTPIRDWASPDALAKCNESYAKVATVSTDINYHMINNHRFYSHNNGANIPLSGLFYAMIYPFLQTTIRAVIWYQGESDCFSGYAVPYACQFPAMIADWRLKWSLYSDTSPDFPFGFVHLSTWNDNVTAYNTPCGNNQQCIITAIVRAAQTANYGFIPNSLMPNTFMATAIDLGDSKSPFGDPNGIHPRYKQQVGDRLAVAAMAEIYGKSELYWGGPIADTVMINGNNVVINFRNVGQNGLVIKNSNGFEIYDKGNSMWITITSKVTNNGDYNILLPIPSNITNVNDITEVRYNWYTAPCSPTIGPYLCAIYDGQYSLPALPFILTITSE